MMDGTDTRARLLGELLAECDEPCPACGYNLRGLTGEACPECGEALRLRVGMVEPRLGLFIAGLLGLAFGTGFHGILGLLVLPQLLTGVGGSELAGFAVLYGGAVVCGGGLVAWVRGRQRIRRIGAGGRALWLTLCWMVPLTTVSWLFAMLD